MTDLEESIEIPDISEKFRQDIVGLVKGNGLRHDEVKTLNSHQEVVEVTGSLVLTLNPNIKEDFVAGESGVGNSYDSKEDAKLAIDEYLSKVSQEPETQVKILKFFEELPGQGWGVEEKEYQIPDVTEKFSYTTQCNTCGGSGDLACSVCKGNGQQPCVECLGKGQIMCAYCKGFKFINENGVQKKCAECNGFGSLTCTNCRGSQTIPCKQCNGAKRIICQDCKKSGRQSVIETVSLSVMPRFSADLSKLNEEHRNSLEAIDINQIAKNGFAIIKPFEQADEEENVEDQLPNAFEKLYKAYIPFMNGEYRLGENKYTAKVIGIDNPITEISPFIDDLVKTGIAAMQKFSKGPFAGDALIAKATKFRVLNGIIDGLMTHSKGYVLKKVMAEYSIGFSKKYAQASVHYSKLALDKLLDKPKYVGLGIGVGASIALIVSYFFLPLREQLVPSLPSEQAIMIADLIIALLALLISYFSVRISAGKALQKYNIGSKGKLPSAGNQGVIGFGIIAVAYLIVLENLPIAPEWYTQLMSGL